MSKTDPAMAAALAAFAAKGGKVTKLERDASSGLTDRQWYAATQGRLDLNAKLRGEDTLCERTERQAERYMERVREARHCGASPSEALDAGREVPF